MTFNEALEKMKHGECVKRKRWSNQCLFMSINVVYGMNGHYTKIRHNESDNRVILFHDERDNFFWTPSQNDILADDWEVV